MSGKSTGAAVPGTVSRPQMRMLQHELAAARDQQIMRVVAMVDAMPVRGEADLLIAALRPRLAILHTPRRLTLARLLFTPVNPLIVAGPDWRREAFTLPRTALQPLADALREELGALAVAVETRLAGVMSDDRRTVQRIGGEIWPAAAEALRRLEMPQDWATATGLSAQDHRIIAGITATGLADAGRLDAMTELARGGIDPVGFDLEEMLTNALRYGADAFATLMTLLAAKLPRAELLLTIAEDVAARHGDPSARAAADRAVDSMLDTIENTDQGQPALVLATGELRRMIALLEDLDSRSSQRPSRKLRIGKLRQEIDTSSRERFSKSLDTELLLPASKLAGASDAAVEQVESSARDLRKFETVARRLGGAEHYDRLLRQAAEALMPQSGEDMATTVDRVRLVEILRGSEAAAAMMAA